MNITETKPDNSHCIEVCNSLLRGEISAVETYGKAIERFASEVQVGELARIRAEHQRSVDALRENVLSMAGVPEIESGAWGVFANGVQSAANLFGDESALFSLKQGEEHGKNGYVAALEDQSVMGTCKDLIQHTLLPRVSAHIATLEKLSDDV